MGLMNFTDDLLEGQVRSYVAVYNYGEMQMFKSDKTMMEVFDDLFPHMEEKPTGEYDAMVVPEDFGFVVIATSLDGFITALKKELEEHRRDIEKILEEVDKLGKV